MELSKKQLEQRWRDPRDDPRLMDNSVKKVTIVMISKTDLHDT